MGVELLPHERAALTVAWAQVQRGEFPMPACATVCVAALARITGRMEQPIDADGRPAPETQAVPTWRCTVCNNVNPDDATHCRQCEYSRTVMRDGKRVARSGPF